MSESLRGFSMGKSLTDQAYEKIKSDIITCKLMPGDQIAQA